MIQFCALTKRKPCTDTDAGLLLFKGLSKINILSRAKKYKY
jgi:hypothetical protein